MSKSDRSAHLHFIQRNLDFLLAVGWQGYQAHGPGAILIDADQAVPDPQWEGGITPGLCISRSLLKEKGLDWPVIGGSRSGAAVRAMAWLAGCGSAGRCAAHRQVLPQRAPQ